MREYFLTEQTYAIASSVSQATQNPISIQKVDALIIMSRNPHTNI